LQIADCRLQIPILQSIYNLQSEICNLSEGTEP
jgi:hypothetical protein